MGTMMRENLIKNVIVALILIPGYLIIQNSLVFSSLRSDKAVFGSLLAAVSILAVIACFGNFAFTYEKVEFREKGARFLAHLTTGLLMLLIGLSLEMTSVITKLLIDDFWIFDLSLLILYIASVLYDFWDIKRTDLSDG